MRTGYSCQKKAINILWAFLEKGKTGISYDNGKAEGSEMHGKTKKDDAG